jgi:hypothetical protein
MKYQMRKAVLPAFKEHLLPKLARLEHKSLKIFEDDRAPEFTFPDLLQSVPFAMFEEIEHMNKKTPWPRDWTQSCAAIGYVMEARKFNYSGGKEAIELTIQIDCADTTSTGLLTAVKWPGRGGKLDPAFRDPSALRGAVVVSLYSKYSERPFGIDDIVVVQPPLDHATTEQSPEPE